MDTITPTVRHNSAITVYDEFRAQLDGLRKLNAETVFDYEDPEGNKDARSHVYKLRKTKSAVEKVRVEEKSASLKYGRRVDEQAKEIALEIDKMIDVHAKPLEEIEQREKDRLEVLRTKLAEIDSLTVGIGARWLELSLEAMKERLADLEAMAVTEEAWDEFAPLAARAVDVALSAIRAAIIKREKHDAEQEELARLRKESADRERQDREEQIRKDAAARVAEEAEAEAVKVKEAAERRESELKDAAETAEREKIEAEQRAADAEKEAEEKVRREAEQEAAEAAKREADKKHRTEINRAAVSAFVKGGMRGDAAKQAVTLVAQKAIPNVSITY